MLVMPRLFKSRRDQLDRKREKRFYDDRPKTTEGQVAGVEPENVRMSEDRKGTDDHEDFENGDEQNLALTKSNTEFAFALYKKLSTSPEFQSKNIIFSPLSISMALSMLTLGAKGETLSQLCQALGYAEMSIESVNKAYQHIIHMLGVTQECIMQTDISNALVVTERAKIMDKFLDDAKKYYRSEAFSVDFSKPDKVVQEINKYIAQQTHNKITDMVKGVDPNTLVILINCIYFRGEWNKKFNEKFTEKDDFHVDDQNKVIVDMMIDVGCYKFYEDKQNFARVLMLPYQGSASMIIVLPDEGKMTEVEDSISQALFRQWEQSLAGRLSYLRLYVPKFSIDGTYSLETTLQEMGMVDVFSSAANLSGLTEEQVVLSKVEHKAILSIDEKGTEASAATWMRLCGSSGAKPEEIKVNRPFLVFITESKTKSVLFMGKISNPTSPKIS